MKNETPDAWIERLPEDAGPQDEDRCQVCGKINCDCPDEEHLSRMVAFAEYKENKQKQQQEKEQEECPHDEHDHGICLECGTDIMEDLIGRAELLRDE